MKEPATTHVMRYQIGLDIALARIGTLLVSQLFDIHVSWKPCMGPLFLFSFLNTNI